jgi:hypothetical protein
MADQILSLTDRMFQLIRSQTPITKQLIKACKSNTDNWVITLLHIVE